MFKNKELESVLKNMYKVTKENRDSAVGFIEKYEKLEREMPSPSLGTLGICLGLRYKIKAYDEMLNDLKIEAESHGVEL